MVKEHSQTTRNRCVKERWCDFTCFLKGKTAPSGTVKSFFTAIKDKKMKYLITVCLAVVIMIAGLFCCGCEEQQQTTPQYQNEVYKPTEEQLREKKMSRIWKNSKTLKDSGEYETFIVIEGEKKLIKSIIQRYRINPDAPLKLKFGFNFKEFTFSYTERHIYLDGKKLAYNEPARKNAEVLMDQAIDSVLEFQNKILKEKKSAEQAKFKRFIGSLGIKSKESP
jgi:hypothetical protein